MTNKKETNMFALFTILEKQPTFDFYGTPQSLDNHLNGAA